jgi:hypothetical protein
MDEYFQPPPPVQAPPPAQKGNKTLLYVGIGCGALIFIGLIAGGLFAWYATQKAMEFADNPAYGTLRLAVAANPELETVSADAATGTITVRDKKTGKIETLTIDSMQDGKLVIAGGDGSKMVFAGGENGQGELVITGKNGEKLVAKGGPGGGSVVVTGQNGEVQAQAQAVGDQIKIDTPAQGDQPAGTVVLGAPGAGGPSLPQWVPPYPGAAPVEGGSLITTSGDQTSGTFSYKTADSPTKVFTTYADALAKAGLAVKTKMETGDGGLLVAASADEKRQVTVTIGKDDAGTVIGLIFTAKP